MLRRRLETLLKAGPLNQQARDQWLGDATQLGLVGAQAEDLLTELLEDATRRLPPSPSSAPLPPPLPPTGAAPSELAPPPPPATAVGAAVGQTQPIDRPAPEIEFVDAEGIEFVPSPPVPPADPRRKLEQRAAELVAMHRGLDSRCRGMLMSEAEALGLPPSVADEVLRGLAAGNPGSAADMGPSRTQSSTATGPEVAPPPATPPAAATPPGAANKPRRGSPAPPPAPSSPRRSPRESYERYLRRAIAQLRREHISVRSEQKLVREGREKLDLGEPFALELLRQVAREMDTPMLSQQAIEEDPRFDEFRRRAAPIIAEQRGVNGRSRMLLSAVGQELDLTEEERDQAILQLSGGVNASLEDAKRASFRQRVEQALARLPGRFVTAALEHELTTAGSEREGLEWDAARTELRAAAGAAGVAVVDRDQAQRHIAALLRDSAAADVAPLADEARMWGLSDQQFDDLLEADRQARAQRRRRERRITTLALSLSGLAAGAMIGGAAWLWWPRQDSTTDVAAQVGEAPADAAESISEGPAPPAKVSPGDDEELQIMVTRARQLMPEQADALQQTMDEDPSRRMAAASQLAGLLPEVASQDDTGDVLTAVLAHWFRAETDDANAKQLLNELLGGVPQSGDAPPEDPSQYAAGYQALEAVVACLALRDLPAERASWLSGRLEEKLAAAVDSSQSWADLERYCAAQLSVLLYRNLIGVASFFEDELHGHHVQLSDRLLSLVEEQRREQLQLEFLVARLVADKEPWQPYEPMIRRLVRSESPPVVLSMASVLERTPDESLQQELSTNLLRRIDVPLDAQPREEVVSLVRTALGGAADSLTGVSANEQAFLEEAERHLAGLGMGETGTESLANELVQSARLATMACALQTGTAAEAVFEELQSNGPPRLIAPDSAPGSPAAALRARTADRAMEVAREQASAQVQLLARTRNVQQRVRIFSSVANSMRQAEDLSPLYATSLARYLVQPKSDSEQAEVLLAAGELRSSPTVVLALADEVAKFDSREPQVEEIAEALVGPLRFGPGENWTHGVQGALLRHALGELRTADPAGIGGARDAVASPARQAGQHLLEFYQTQASLRGVSESEVAKAGSVGDVIALMIAHVAQQIPADQLDPADQSELREIPHQLAAAANAASNDVQRTVLLQRVWLRLLRIELLWRDGGSADAGRDIVQRLAALDRHAGSALEQVRDGEAQLLQMWRLCYREAPG